MKIENFMIIFSCILVAGMLLMHFTTEMTITANDLTHDYKKYVETAVDGAVDSVINHTGTLTDRSGNLWDEERMKIASDTFYNSLGACLGYPIGLAQEDLDLHVPFVAYVDNDGFYVYYIDGTEDENGVRGFEKKLSDKHQWIVTDEYNNEVMLTMSDLIYVITEDGTKYEDNFSNIYQIFHEQFEKDGLQEPEWLHACRNELAFEQYKHITMTQKLENNLNYYLNLADNTWPETGRSYYIHLDYEDTTTKQTVEKPGFIAFFQGPVASNHQNKINIYTMACRTIDTGLMFPATYNANNGFLEYHDPRKCDIPKYADSEHGIVGNIFAEYTSMEKAAASGAYPCEICW